MDFLEYEIGPETVRPSKKFFSAIENIKRPETLTDARSIFGLVEQIAYTCYCSEIMAPFRELLKSSNSEKEKITWTDELEVAFKAAKAAMIEAMSEGVKIYNKDLPLAYI